MIYWVNLVLLVFNSISLLFLICFYFYFHKKIKIQLEDKRKSIIKELEIYRDEVKRYDHKKEKLFDEISADVRKEMKDKISKFKIEFENQLNKSYTLAVDQIDFDRIEYKKTITKKRREFSKKNKPNTTNSIWSPLQQTDEVKEEVENKSKKSKKK